MEFKGVILTGTSGAGKSTIAKLLEDTNPNYKIAKAVTTRERRPDDINYEYLSQEEFEKIEADSGFFTFTKYRNGMYGVINKEIEDIIANKQFVLLIISPESFRSIQDRIMDKYLSFFIDAPDEELDKRLIERDHTEITEDIKAQRKNDRIYSDDPHYIIQNLDVNNATKLIERLVETMGKGSILAQSDIHLMISNGMLVRNATCDNIKGASYDLRLGDEYLYGGEIKKIEGNSLRITIEPYDYAIVSCKEEICLPKDVVAHFGLTVGLFCQGIILSNGQQVDPGFRGTLFCLLFNTSDKPVTIKRNDHYATIEFTKMDSFANKYNGKYQEKRNVIDVIPQNAMQGAVYTLKREIDELKSESREFQSLYISVMAIIVAAISLLLIIR